MLSIYSSFLREVNHTLYYIFFISDTVQGENRFLVFYVKSNLELLASKTTILILRKIHQNCYSHPLELSKTVFKFLIN